MICSTTYSGKLSRVRPNWGTNESDEMCQVGDEFLVDESVKPSSPSMFDQFNKVLFYAYCLYFILPMRMF